MPSRIGAEAWRGYNAELLAEFMIGCIAFTTRVAHQEDIGHDLHCMLKKRREVFIPRDKASKVTQKDLYIAEPYFFTVQVKKVYKGSTVIKYDHQDSVEWIKKQVNPFFVCLADRTKLSISLYSTWNMHPGFLRWGDKIKKVVLRPDKPIGNEIDPYIFISKSGTLSVPLGKPILRFKIQEIVNETIAMAYAEKLREWISLDQENIFNKGAYMYWITSPASYIPNRKLSTERKLTLFCHANNLRTVCLRNFGRAATHLKLVLKLIKTNRKNVSIRSSRPHKEHALDQALKAYFEDLEPKVRGILSKEFGQGLTRKTRLPA